MKSENINLDQKILETAAHAIIHCDTAEEAELLWNCFNRNGYIRKSNESDNLENFIDCMPDYCISPNGNTWVPIAKIVERERINFSELN